MLSVTAAALGLTLNIQQLSSMAPERSSNYRSSQPDSLYLHLPLHRSGLSVYFMCVRVCGRGVNESQWEREKTQTLHLCTHLPPLLESLKNIILSVSR